MGRVTRRVVLLFLSAVLFVAVSVPAAAERLQVPGGAAALRRVTGIPDHIPDSMLFAEAARAWFTPREPARESERARLVEYLTTSTETKQPGPWLPLSIATWMRLLEVHAPSEVAAALARHRDAMLLYRGLVGLDDGSLAWLEGHPDVLKQILIRSAPIFATAGPSISVVAGAVVVPGGRDAVPAWSSLVGASPLEPEKFIPRLLERENGRLAWLFASIAALDPARQQFACGVAGANLPVLGRHFSTIAPEWTVADRPFWRPAFDPTIPLMLLRPDAAPVAGTDQFWREVFHSDDLKEWRDTAGAPLTAAALIELLFEDHYKARARWEAFSLGQRMLRSVNPGRDAGLALRAAMRFPALAVSLDRMGILTPVMLQQMAEAAGRIAGADPYARLGILAAWQAALVTVERAAISGGLDRAETSSVVTSLARLPLNEPRRELTTWFLGTWIERLLLRPGAPAAVEAALLRTMSGDLTAKGPRATTEFMWEDLPYSFAGEHRTFERMQEVRAAQGGPTLGDARVLSTGKLQADLAGICQRLQEMGEDPTIASLARRLASSLSKTETDRIDRERRELAETIVARVLPLVAYAPQQAASDAPTLGADIARRHEIAMNEGPEARRRRPWQLAIQVAFAGQPWHLAGSLLSLDLPLSAWYLRMNGEAPMDAPAIDEPDVYSLALTPVLASEESAARIVLTLDAIRAGRDRAASAPDLAALDALLASRGFDPWRRRALRVESASPGDIAARLTPSEAWRLGGDGGAPVSPRLTLDGCACLGETPFAPMLVEGRAESAMVGAAIPGLTLRVATFLDTRRLPLALFRALLAGVTYDVIHSAPAIRGDDILALDVAAANLPDARLEDHVLALIADGTLATPSPSPVVH